MALWQNSQVSACCLDYDGHLAMGDWRRSTMAKIWHGEAYRTLRDALASGRPEGFPLCNGCPHSFHHLRRSLARRSARATSLEDRIPVVGWEF